MALVDPNIAMGYRGIEVPNQLAQYGQLTQIQNAQNQNRMADLQAQEYERARSEEEGTRNFLRGKDLKSPEVRLGLMEFGKTGLAMAKSLSDQEAAAATLANTKSQTSERDFKLQKDKLKHGWESMGDAPTPQAAIERLNDGVAKGYFDMKAASAEIQKLESMTTPEQYRQYRIDKLTGIMDAKDQLTNLLPKVARQEAGGQIVSIQDNPMMPGYGQPIAGAAINKTETFADKTAKGQLAVAQGNLNVARDRLAKESDPVLQQNLAQAKALGQKIAVDQVTRATQLPKVLDTAEMTLKEVDDLIGKRDNKGALLKGQSPHPGFGPAVGMGGFATLGIPGVARFIPGTDASDFQSRFDQIKGGAFLQAFETLKGGGSITNVEGDKGTAALNRMSLAQSEKEFIQAALEFKSIVAKGVERAKKLAGSPAANTPAAPVVPAAPASGGVIDFGSLR